MARLMEEKRNDVYRYVAKTTYLEDVKAHTDEYGREVPAGKAGKTYTEIFGPHSEPWRAQNYTMRQYYKRVEDGVEPEFDRWGRKNWNAGQPKVDYVKVAEKTGSRLEKLTPVLAINPNGSLTLDMDWMPA